MLESLKQFNLNELLIKVLLNWLLFWSNVQNQWSKPKFTFNTFIDQDTAQFLNIIVNIQ